MNQGSDETRIQGRNTRSIWQKQLELRLTGSKFESYHYHWKNSIVKDFSNLRTFLKKVRSMVIIGANQRVISILSTQEYLDLKNI